MRIIRKAIASLERKIDQLAPQPSQAALPGAVLRGALSATLPHPEAHVQHEPKPRSAVLRLAPGRSGKAAATRWAACQSPG